jgi:hypothetical protein
MTKQISALMWLLAFPAIASGQATAALTTDTAAAKPAAPQTPALDFSGILYANYQYRGDAGPAKSSNKFDVERAYLTFRVAAGKRTSVRITTDLYQQSTSGSDAYYRGWSVRAKYAYLQYNYLDTPDWHALARIGLLQTVFIEQDEQFWPRWISQSPTERAGYFSSADAGLATSIALPRKAGEVYATITNGPGYTARETDRFKDYAARLTLTPWGNQPKSVLKPIALSVWGYKGATASKFVTGGPGQLGSVGDGLIRDRWGVHIGSASPRLTLGAEYASRHEEGELGNNTPASLRNVVDSTGTLASAYALVRPLMFRDAAVVHPLSLMARYDRVITNTDKDARYDVIIAGIIWDLSSKASVSFDYQETNPVRGAPIATSKTYFAHFVARF